MIWDKLPEDIQTIIYNKVIYMQPKCLLDDLISYVNTMELITNHNCIPINYTDWDILWFLVLSYYKKDNMEKEKHFNYMKRFVLNNDDLMIRYEGAIYWIKKYIKYLSIEDRKKFIYSINKT